MSCSCGLPARMKYPCRHILYLIGGYYQQMFALRWRIFYQHAFERKGYEDVTAIYREIGNDQFSRDWKIGEHILVADCGNFKTINDINVSDKPVLLQDTLTIDPNTMMYLDKLITSGQPVIRSNDININVDSINTQTAEDSELTAHLSQQTNTMKTINFQDSGKLVNKFWWKIAGISILLMI